MQNNVRAPIALLSSHLNIYDLCALALFAQMKSYSCRSDIISAIKCRMRSARLPHKIRQQQRNNVMCVDYHNFLYHDLSLQCEQIVSRGTSMREHYNKVRGSMDLCVRNAMNLQNTKQSKWKRLKSNSTDRWTIEIYKRKIKIKTTQNEYNRSG